MITESDTCRKYVLPRLYDAGWSDDQIAQEKVFTKGGGIAYLEISNEHFYAFVFDDTKLNFQLAAGGGPNGTYVTRKNSLVEWSGEHFPDKPYNGVLYYAMPCVFESLRVQRVAEGEMLYEASAGKLPEAVRQADLVGLPALRMSEERTVQRPWRLDRCYVPVGRYLVFDCTQFYERRRPSQRKAWEQVRAELRQVVDVVGWARRESLKDHSVIRRELP